jgi:hypothetical protein
MLPRQTKRMLCVARVMARRRRGGGAEVVGKEERQSTRRATSKKWTCLPSRLPHASRRSKAVNTTLRAAHGPRRRGMAERTSRYRNPFIRAFVAHNSDSCRTLILFPLTIPCVRIPVRMSRCLPLSTTNGRTIATSVSGSLSRTLSHPTPIPIPNMLSLFLLSLLPTALSLPYSTGTFHHRSQISLPPHMYGTPCAYNITNPFETCGYIAQGDHPLFCAPVGVCAGVGALCGSTSGCRAGPSFLSFRRGELVTKEDVGRRHEV